MALALVASPLTFAKDTPEYTQFGHEINVAPGQKTGDLTCFACSIHIRGDVAGDVTTFLGSVVLEGDASVAGDVTTFGGTVRLGSGTKIGGDLTAMGGKIARDSHAEVGGDVTAFEGQGWLLAIFGLPVFMFAGLVAFIIWLVQRRQRPVQTYARAA
jgi:hypothetical protein